MDNDGSGGACPGTLPFAPSTSVTLGNTNAGASNTLSLSTTRADGEQILSGVHLQLPPGMVANIASVPQCSNANANAGTCAAASQIGTTTVTAGAGTNPYSLTGQVYLTTAYNGQPFGLAITVPAIAGPFNLGTAIVRASIAFDIPNGQVTINSDPLPTILDGIPLRLRNVTLDVNAANFITNPTTCTSASVTGSISDTNADLQTFTQDATMSGCGSLAFNPTITATPTTTQRDTPTGLAIDLHVPNGNSDLNSATVQLPQGMSINPSVANTLGTAACTDALFAANNCPATSAVGTAEIDSPLVSTPFTGHVYVGSQTNNTYEIFLDANDPTDNLDVHLTGTVTADTTTGQLTTTFTNTPPIPFTDLKLTFTGGPDALLANNQNCATATTTATLTPNDGNGPATPITTNYTVDNDGTGGTCPGTLPFNPYPQPSLTTTSAGASDDLTLTLSRADGDQTLSAVTPRCRPAAGQPLHATPQCSNANANAGTCAASSQIGDTTVTAGSGSDPYSLTGHVYLTTAYNGEPFGLAIVVHALAGPYDLGTVVVRGSIAVDTTNGQVTIATDPFPTILDGVPLRLRTVAVDIDAPNFLTNPTVCTPQALTGTITSTGSASANFTDTLTMTGCGSLAFNPTITVTPGTTKRDSPTGLAIDLHVPNGNSDLQSASVTLPAGMSINPSVANSLGTTACTDAQFAANSCPPGSAVGTAEIDTPLLANTLTGNVYVGAETGNTYELFLDADDAADNLDVHLTGSVTADPSTGQLTTTFPTAPPIQFSDLKLDFTNTTTPADDLLANPLACGTATTTTDLTPNSGGAHAHPSASFTVDNDGSGGACPGTLPFAPSAVVTPGNTSAGAYNTLGLGFSRADGDQFLSSITAALPPGMLANLSSIPRCDNADANAGTCATSTPASQIGTTTITAGAGTDPLSLNNGKVYLTAAYGGQPFGLSIVVDAKAGPYDLGTVVVRAAVNVDTTDGQVTITTDPLPTILQGVLLRLRTVNIDIDAANFLTNPTSCSALALSGTLTSTTAATSSFSQPVTMTGCGPLPFSPTLSVTPSTTRRDTPTGLDVDVHLPGGSSDLQSAAVTLPAGMSINPSAANGLAACSDVQFAAGTNTPVSCPAASAVGTVEIDTPLLAGPLTGNLYVGTQQSGHPYRVFLDAEDAADGLNVRLVGDINADATTGQLTATFANVPDIPFTDLKLHFNSGSGALLANGLACGTATTTSSLTPYSGNPAATPSDQFTVDNDGSGGACPGTLPFAPSTSVTLGNTNAGASNTLSLSTTRADGEQILSGVHLQLPPGMVANIASVPQCSNANANAGTCAAASQIGTTTVTAGAGTNPYSLTGQVYLTTAYNGQPFGLAITVPAIAGPFNLGTAIVRASIAFDIPNGQVTINSDPLPTILDGIPLRLRNVTLDVNAANFITNPTTCTSASVTGSISDTNADLQTFTQDATMSGCGSLAFNPTITATPTTTQRDTPTGLAIDLHVPNGNSDLNSATVQLPQGMSINPSVANTLGTAACTDALFAANNCPATSAVGTAEIDSPLVSTPFTGHVYVGSQTNNTYEIFLDANDPTDNLDVHLTGTVTADTTTGQLTTTFTNTPPIPFTDLKLTFTGGPDALLANNQNCATATTTATLTPNDGNGPATPITTNYTVDNDGTGGTCPGTLPFNPVTTATLGNTTAGAATSLTLSTARSDGDQTLSSIDATLPPGLLANLSATPQCSNANANAGTCAASSQIGDTTVTAGSGSDPYSLTGHVYLTTAYGGEPFGLAVVVHALAGPYDLGTVVVRGSIAVDTTNGQVTIATDPFPTILDGVPLRLRTISVDINAANFLTNPTVCTPQALTGTITATGSATANFSDTLTMSGCGALLFNPTLSVTPGTTQRDAATALDVDVHLPVGNALLGSASVTLPSGMAINPSAANGLQACTAAELGAGTNNPVTCPAASAVGTVEIDTPLLTNKLTGDVYVGPQTNNTYEIFLDAEDAVDGLSVRLIGTITADPTTGQLTTSFPTAPPIAFTDLKLHFNGGGSALLVNPPTCGTAASTSVLTPNSGGANQQPGDSFTVDNDGAGGACPGTLPFNPTTTTTLGNTDAGASNTLTLTTTRVDGDQTLSTIAATLPPGMLANLSTVPQCSNANANAGTCAAASQIGTATVTAGAGPSPLPLTGQVYLTTAYGGKSFGLSIVVPALAGPYNLGTVVVRASVAVNTTTGQVTIDTDALPTILQGIPLHLHSVAVAITAPGFLTNPSSCNPLQLTGTVTSNGSPAATASINDPVQMTGCGAVPFNPTVTVTPGTTQRDAPTGLAVDVHIPSGDSALQSASVTLPPGMSINPSAAATTHGLQTCTDAELAAGTNNPVTCPAASAVGTVEIDTPLLPLPSMLTGTIYLGQPQNGNPYRVFLDAEDVIDGLNVRLVGSITTDPTTGQVTTTFPTAPPIPFTDLKLNFSGGSGALLANPLSCGPVTATSDLTPTSGGADAKPTSTFTVDNDGAGGPCASAIPFHPTVATTLGNNNAGADDTLDLQVARNDGDQTLSTVSMQLPQGMLAKLTSVPLCSDSDANAGNCGTTTPASQIGTVAVTAGAGSTPVALSGKVYLTTAHAGATLGLSIVVDATSVGPYDLGDVVVRGAINVDTSKGQISISTDPLPTVVQGIPLRLRTMDVSIDQSGFLFNPSTCDPADITGTIGSVVSDSAAFSDPVQMTGCSALPFNPTVTVTPGTTQADSPSGLTVDVQLPPNSADLQSATVQLPAGMTIDPSVAANPLLQICTDAQFAAGTNNPVTCPSGSQIGTVRIDTPLLSTPLTGAIYIGAQTGSTFEIFVDAEDPTYGLSVRLVGTLTADTSTGQLTATFASTPQIPFTDFMLSFQGGANAPLATPATCGTATSTSTLMPSSGGAPATSSDSFTVDSNGAGGSCAPTPGFSPTLSVTQASPTAGAYDPIAFDIATGDGQQGLGTIAVTLPPGLLGAIGQVPQCSDSDANAGTCPAGSAIGTARVSAGVGSDPLSLPGTIYLTGHYKDGPFGLSIVVPAVAGPYNLGTVVVRAAIGVDRHDAHLTITSDPLPTILQGIPLRLKAVSLAINRASFIFNPTGCGAAQVGGTITSATGTTAAVSAPFAVSGCAGLPFAPPLSAVSEAATSTANGASFRVNLAPRRGDTNLKSASVQLPSVFSARMTTIQQACAPATYQSDPSHCPAGAYVGHAAANSPVLPDTLTGRIYLVTVPNGLPTLNTTLTADGVSIDLTGTIAITAQGVVTTFDSIPDVPIDNVSFTFPSGPYSALGANASLCQSPLEATAALSGQSGTSVKTTTTVKVQGCPTSASTAGAGAAGKPSAWLHISIVRVKYLSGHAVKAELMLPASGAVTLSASMVKKATGRTVGKARFLWVTLHLTKTGVRKLGHHRHMSLRVKAAYRPKAGRSGWVYLTFRFR